MVKQTRSTHIFLIPYVIASKKSHTLKCRTFALWYFLFSKRQHIHLIVNHLSSMSCCCYHKGRNFQANHNSNTARQTLPPLLLLPQRQEFSSKSQLSCNNELLNTGCCCYHKGRNFQANHNQWIRRTTFSSVVVATTKVGIFKQITTANRIYLSALQLLLLPQRQEFSSKSQHARTTLAMREGCCCYHKGRNFQANHNRGQRLLLLFHVVVATTKVGIFKQITT